MSVARVTKDQIKSEIDKVREEYLEVLYRIVQSLEGPSSRGPQPQGDEAGWRRFVSEMYGSTADAPLKRWPAGASEERLALE